MEPLADWLGRLAFLDILEYVGKLGVLVVVILWLWTAQDRYRQDRYEAWQVVNTAQEQEGVGGRKDALEYLYKEGVPLTKLSIDGAYLAGIDLYDEDEGGAELYSMSAQGADLAGADLHKAGMWRANLRNAFLGREIVGVEGKLRACADRLATFHICRFSERSNRLLVDH